MAADLHGLVMAGGYSRRMGRDKALIDYHGVPQALWTARLLAGVCGTVHLSCREGQDLGGAEEEGYGRIHDLEDGQGPIGGLLAAHAADPRAAWLAVACDLPQLDRETLLALVAERRPDRLATVFRSSSDGLPEPLCAIYEPAMMPHLRAALESGRRCPRKLMIEQGPRVRLIDLPNVEALNNANTPQEAADYRGG